MSRSPERVMLVSYEYPPLGGGGGVMFRDLAEELARSIDVTVLTSGSRGLEAEEKDGSLSVVRVPVLLRDSMHVASLPSLLSFFPSSLTRGLRLMRRERYDLVHSSFAVPSGPSAVMMARRHRVPHVLSIHGGDIWDPSKSLSPHRVPLLKQTVRWVLDHSDRVVAQSSDTASRTCEIYGERCVDRVPLAVHPVPFEPMPREAFGLAEGEVVLITIGRLIARKGLDQLIQTLAELGDPHVRLLVLGEGPDRPELERAARAAGVAERIDFRGFVSEVEKWQLLSVADLYVSTALHEGFGIVFLEAMQSALPVVCYDRGGQTDFLTGAFARLVAVNDRERFRRELEPLLRDAALRRRLGEAARTEAAAFSVGAFAGRYLRIYEECLAASPRAG